ncbi:MAG: ATP-dependent DNA helicase RecG [Planctomycetaceae bacterium]|nr:MAG: ATP-dependent DNA helicase RecG [Planctomycetaceae bacterium]
MPNTEGLQPTNSPQPGVPLTLGTDIRFVPGVGSARARLLRRLGIHTAGQALFFFPRAYEHPAPGTAIGELRDGRPASLVGRITEVEISSRTAGKSVLGALVENEQGAVRLLFFNQPGRVEQLRRGCRVLVSGTPKLAGFRMEFIHPKVVLLEEDETAPGGQILPIYSLVEGLKQGELRKLTATVVAELAESIEEVLDEPLRALAAARIEGTLPGLTSPLCGITTALREIHQPSGAEALEAARRRLIFQELFVLQLALAVRRRRLTTALTAPPLPPTSLIDARIRNRFAFELTADQVAAIREVGQDMARQFPMNRLVQGDVGSGKTVIAQYAILLAVAHGHQAVMMAPTEVLARQHHQTLTRALAHSRVRIGLLCGSLTATQRREVLRRAETGDIDVLVGTQALLHGDIRFAKLGLCVIDEQHKFGVTQRQALRRGDIDPHYLVLSATPIPRTITMTMFGDLDVSTLRQKPPGRGAVHTYLAEDAWRDRWWRFVAQRIDEGRQAFVVTPRVCPDPVAADDAPATETDAGQPASAPAGSIEDEDAASVEEVTSAVVTFDQLRQGPLADYRVGLLHGRMTTQEKTETMERFAQGRIQVLVTTSVIEVGIDVPNATVMTILGAERFGLAQLHQLRGRVSRGTQDGHVCLFTDAKASPNENERLKTFSETHDGFAIAEADFRLRGPGDLMGRSQSGMPPMRIADLTRDETVLGVAREIAQETVDLDAELSAPSAAGLKKQVFRRYGDVLDLGDVA